MSEGKNGAWGGGGGGKGGSEKLGRGRKGE